MCLFCATTKKLSNAYQQFMQRRKRNRMYRNMQRYVSPVRHVPAISDGIETYNYKGGK